METRRGTIPVVGCDVLQREITSLAARNGWDLDLHLKASSFHIDYDRLRAGLTSALEDQREKNPLVFIGACHPQMDEMLEAYSVGRTTGQNCLEMLLGKETFTRELEQGALFFLEGWIKHWKKMFKTAFGGPQHIIQEIISADRKYLLAIRTPCSDDFSADAVSAAKYVGLPLAWKEVSLEHLESVLALAIRQRNGERLCPT